MSDSNPLTFHGIIVIVVGVMLLGLGAWGTIKTASAKRPGSSAMRGMSQVTQTQSSARRVAGAGRLARKPTSLTGAMSQGRQIKGIWYLIKRYLSMGWMILLGGGMIAAGVFILKQKNWARLVGFVGVSFAILYFAGQQGTVASINKSVAVPAILTSIAAALTAVPLWGLMIEKFD